MMVSRLDRLFILLETGSSDSVRLAAAKQLGEVQRVQPNDLDYLLKRIKEYSGKSSWETRVAAGNATKYVLEHVDPWPKSERSTQTTEDNKLKCKQEIAEKLILDESRFERILGEFDLEKIVAECPKLLSLDTSNLDEHDNVANAKAISTKGRVRRESGSRYSSNRNDKEQLMRQRKLINKELGIAMVDSLNLGVKSTDIVTNDDLQTDYDLGEMSSLSKVASETNQIQGRDILQISTSNYDKMINILIQANCIPNRDPKAKSQAASEIIQEENATIIHTNDTWPLNDITREYMEDLYHPCWEIRHGAAITLREVVKLHGKSAGKRADLTTVSNNKLNQLWLLDTSLKALGILALDKFGDFLFDQVVAPVRENAAQLFGCCIANMSEDIAYLVIKLILEILENPNWEARHGGILGLKYSLNIVEKSFSKRLLSEFFEPIFKCLADPVDDVSAEAAAALVPVKDLMIEIIPDKAPKLIKFLWEHLADLDELTSSTSNIVLLLASLITSDTSKMESGELVQSIPRLWSLLSHSSTSVRISVLKALTKLTQSQNSTCLSWMPENLMTTALRLIFQRSILENMDDVRPYIESVWMNIIRIEDCKPESHSDRFNLLKSSSQYLNYWACLVMQPTNIPIDRSTPTWLNIRSDGQTSDIKPEGEVYIGSITFNADTMQQQKQQVTKCRLLGTKLIGALYANLTCETGDTPESQHPRETLNYLAEMFVHYTKTKSAHQRIISGWIVESWANYLAKLFDNDRERLSRTIPETLVRQLNTAIQETSLCYDELAPNFTRLQQEAREFAALLMDANLFNDSFRPTLMQEKRAIYQLNQIKEMTQIDLSPSTVEPKRANISLIKNSQIDEKKLSVLLSKRETLAKSLKSTNMSQRVLSTSVLSSLACALISWNLIPKNLNIVINPLLTSIEIEEDHFLQDKSIKYLVVLLDSLCAKTDHKRETIEDILKRLIDSSCCKAISLINDDLLSLAQPPDSKMESSKRDECSSQRIILLDNLQRRAEFSRTVTRRQNSVINVPNLKRSHSLTLPVPLEQVDASLQPEPPVGETCDTKMRGANNALAELVEHFGKNLPVKLPQIWKYLTDDIKIQVREHLDSEKDATTQLDEDIKLVKNLQLILVIGSHLDVDLRGSILDLFHDLIKLFVSQNSVIRHYSAQCIGMSCKIMLPKTIGLVKEIIVPMLEESENILAKYSSIEAIALIIEHLQLDLVPHINMFIIQVLRRMSDQNEQVRLLATHCFGKLLSLMPLNLEKAIRNTNETSCKFQEQNLANSTNQDDQRFIEQLLDPKRLDNFVIPFEMKAELRSYQQDGLNWLAFLNRFNLHGILCDEMGLGKTFMTLCIVASDHYFCKQSETKCQPSLIVCPSILTQHWFYEIRKFLHSKTRSILNPVVYAGMLSERASLRSLISDSFIAKTSDRVDNGDKINLVIASYDIVRNDIGFFKDVHWNYCVLDEGHITKNGKTKLSKAIKLLTAKHRLILSGTPIQNNVTELWSLFDFLMPGFLGSERQFNNKYAKQILQSREPKCSARELEAGALAMESLHRQVLPFILRRLKEDVLADLPPKIIQDYYCELSPLQSKLYEDFTRSSLYNDVTRKSLKSLDEHVEETLGNSNGESNSKDNSSSKRHVFQALQYLKNVCNHPKLVLTEKHSQYAEIKKSLDDDKSSLDDISHSSKLRALKQLLIDCGIGASYQSIDCQQATQSNQMLSNQTQQSLAVESVVNQHRALIFCQLRSMVNIVESDLLKKHFPEITYLKLDGSVATSQRHSIVSRFNNDPSIDILLLTTQIGGLGLNLTGADTVIFVEHDWNPTKDLQAMDRAHRIGQKKVVNVYRLITKATLEEKIMGLQKFKTMVSNTVINQDNTALGSMNVDQLFDLFEVSAGDNWNDKTSDKKKKKKKKKEEEEDETDDNCNRNSRSYMNLLPELWDQQEYETEYDLNNFVSSLRNEHT